MKKNYKFFSIIFFLFLGIISIFYTYKCFIYKENVKIINSIELSDLVIIKAFSFTNIDSQINSLKLREERFKKLFENIDKNSISYYKEKIKKNWNENNDLYVKFLKMLEFEFQNKNFFEKASFF